MFISKENSQEKKLKLLKNSFSEDDKLMKYSLKKLNILCNMKEHEEPVEEKHSSINEKDNNKLNGIDLGQFILRNN